MTRALTFATALAALASVSTPAFAADPPKSGGKVFEMRTYTTLPGRLDSLNARFRDHTCKLFQKHGMELVGFWIPQDEKDGKADTLVYLLAFPSRDAAKASWKAFQDDPDWKSARDASEKDGKIVKKVVSVFLDPTDYSAIK